MAKHASLWFGLAAAVGIGWALGLVKLAGAPAPDADPFLAAVGMELRAGHGHGATVVLRGVNLGGWLVREAWMTPLDAGGAPDDWSARAVLAERFGQAESDRLLAIYEDAWLGEADFDRIAALGCNVVRLPFWYRNLQEEDGTWRADAFRRLDWCVAQAGRRGIYVVLDLHGAPGGQSDKDTTGRARKPGAGGASADFWTNPEAQRRTEELWRRVAGHFRGNPWVAAYDLLNEPTGAPSRDALWNVYDRLYRAVRAVDAEHVVSVEGCWSGHVDGRWIGWGWDALPPPERFGWKNVLYQTHAYEWAWNDLDKQKAMVDRQIADREAHRAWQVPGYIGEFNCMAPEAAWQYAGEQYAAHRLSCSMWNFKATHGSGTDSWGMYNPRDPLPPKPDLGQDAANVIGEKWRRWNTAASFDRNPMLARVFGRTGK